MAFGVCLGKKVLKKWEFKEFNTHWADECIPSANSARREAGVVSGDVL